MIRLTHPKESFRLAATVLLALCAQGAIAADYQTTVLNQNPLAYWRLDEGAASPALNTLANQGTLGAAGNGIVVRQVTKGQAGKVGNAISLYNGGSAIACYSKVDVPFNAALNPPAPFSVELWAYPTRNDQTLCALSSMNCQYFGGASRLGWLIYENANLNWQFRLGLSSGYAKILSSSVAPVVNAWQHIVATFDGTTANIYVNGVLRGTGTVGAGWTPNTQMPLMFGALPLDGGGADTVDGPACSFGGIAGYRGFDGMLDEVAIYPSVLSAQAVANHYAAAATPATYGATILADKPVGYWNCDEPVVTAPDPATFPIASNIGSVGAALNGTNYWGALAAQSGPGYTGMGGTGDKACFFDGDNGYVALGDDPAMHFSGQITMMAWVRSMSVDYFRNIIGHGWDNNYKETFLRLSQGDDGTGGSDGNNYYEAGVSVDGTEAGYNNNVTRFPIPPGDVGNWVFLAATYDGNAWNLYRNGQLVSQTVTANGALDVTNRWSIGSRSGPSPTVGYGKATLESEGLFFNGSIDEPAIFSTALPAATINAIYNSALVPPVITRAPQIPAGIYKGSSASFSVWAEGSPTLGYLWTSNGISTGVTATNLTLNNLSAGTLTVAVIVTNAYGSATGTASTVVVAAAPFFIQQPKPITRYTGLPFTFSLVAAGTTPMTFQWYKDGTAIAGANSAAYSGTTGSGTAGNYYCIALNEAGATTSTTNALTVLPIPSGYAGAVIADGPVSYWRLGEASGTTANDYYGGNNGTYYSAKLGQPGYSVLDSDTAVAFAGINSYAGDISGTAITFVGTTANFTLEAWVKAPAGQADQATIIAKGIGPLNTTRNEQFALDVSGNVYHFFTTGNNNSTYDANATVGPNGTWQHVVGVYDNASSTMLIYVNGQLQGSGGTRPAGLRSSSVPVSIGSKRTGNDPAYDGTFNGTIDEVAVYPHALSLASIQAHYAAAYGTSLAPFILFQPDSLTNYVSLPAIFSVSAAGSQPLSYQWKKNGVDIASATDSAYTNTSLTLADAGNYSVTIQNTAGSTNSAAATLTVLSPPTSPVVIPGLVLHLPFDSSLADTSGRGNSGTGKGAISYVPDGALGSALHYFTDPTAGTNYVTLGVRPDLQFSSNVNFSVSYWIRLPANYIAGDLPFFTDTVGSTFGNGYVFAPSYGPATANWPGGWAMSIYGTGGGIGVYGDIGSINDGNWHHLLHSIDRRNGAVTYLDGKVAHENLKAGTTAAAAGDITTGAAATIGQDPNGTYNEPGSADIDDLGVWRKALSPLEAASIYMAAISNKLSFASGGTFSLTMTRVSGTQIQLSWSVGTLQAADKVDGPYTPVGALSPYTVTVPATGNKFYKLAL